MPGARYLQELQDRLELWAQGLRRTQPNRATLAVGVCMQYSEGHLPMSPRCLNWCPLLLSLRCLLDRPLRAVISGLLLPTLLIT